MHTRGGPSPALLRLAAAQADVVTREQAIGLGLSRHTLTRLVGQHQWQRLAPGLFLTHSSTAPWASLAWAGVLLGGSGARLGEAAAAYANRLLDDPPAPITVLVAHDVKVRDQPHWTFVRERPGARSPRTTGSPPCTLVPDTVLDLCEQADARRIEDWVTTAVERGLTTPRQLQRALTGRSRHSRRLLLTQLLVDVSDGAESPLELRYLRDVERRHGLPDGRRQRYSRDGSARCDVWYEEYALLVELDGRKGHEGRGKFRDMRRDNRAVVGRLATLRYGFGDVAGDACEVAWQVAGVLMDRGWAGELLRCRGCPRG